MLEGLEEGQERGNMFRDPDGDLLEPLHGFHVAFAVHGAVKGDDCPDMSSKNPSAGAVVESSVAEPGHMETQRVGKYSVWLTE